MELQSKVRIAVRFALVALTVLTIASALVWVSRPLWSSIQEQPALARPQFYQYKGDGDSLFSGPPLEGSATYVPIIVYHGVVEEADGTNTTIENFVKQMEALKSAGYQTISLEDFSNFQNGTFQLPAKPIIITFDDSRKDSYYNADDVLKKLGFQATMFVIVGLTDEGDSFHLSWDELREMRDSGRWDIEAHGYDSHDMVADKGYFLVTRYDGETDDEFAARIAKDYSLTVSRMSEMLGRRPTAYAIPFGDYGISLSPSRDPNAYALNERTAESCFTYLLRWGDIRRNTATCNLYALARREVKDMSGEELIAALETGQFPSATSTHTNGSAGTGTTSTTSTTSTTTDTTTGQGETPTVSPYYDANVLSFGGYHWQAAYGYGCPGPNNNWDASNAWVDENGWLHLKITKQGNKWYCAAVKTIEWLGFGEYEFQVVGQIDKLDPNVVLGLFSCPTADIRPAGTDEIDLEYSRWGMSDYYNASYGVWGTQAGLGQVLQEFYFDLNGTYSTHRYSWDGRQIVFQSLYGHTKDDSGQFAYWQYAPEDYSKRIAQQSMPVQMNFWLFGGHAPTDGQEAEIVISSFTFTPCDPGTTPVITKNTAPTVEAGLGATINEGGTFSGAGSFADPDTDYWSGTVNYGDGSGVQTLTLDKHYKTFALSHTYADNGTYIVAATVSDGNGGVGTDTVTVTVNSVAPTVEAGPNQTANEGATVILSGSFTDPGADAWTATVDYGDGSSVQPLTLNAAKTFSLSHVYADNGTYTVTVTVTDNDDALGGTDTATVTVSNVAPVVAAGPDATISVLGTFSGAGSFSDSGADTWTATVNYGDGSGPQNLALSGKTFTLNHTYLIVGSYVVTVTVVDDEGGTGVDTVLVVYTLV